MSNYNLFTNEEINVPCYRGSHKPTIPSHVSHDTPLEDLNLNWKEFDLPEKERTKHVHRLHPYLGKFIPQLVEVFLRKYFKSGQTILDPFCGSGTTLVQANELGINSIGFDVSAFNILLCKAKINKYNIHQVQKEILDILNKVGNQTDGRSQVDLFYNTDICNIDEIDNTYLWEWFAPKSLFELITYRNLIYTEKYEYSDILKIILSRSARSARLTTHYDLDFPKVPQTKPYQCYKHSKICEPTQEAFKFLYRYSIDTIERLKAFSYIRTDASVVIEHADSRTILIPQIDGVITSPPYVGLINYHEQHIYAYHLLGLKDNREKEIGPASEGSSKLACEIYKRNIIEVFINIKSSLNLNSRVIVVANDKFNLYQDIAHMSGFQIEAVLQRHVNRRTGRRSGNFYESVFIWKKSL